MTAVSAIKGEKLIVQVRATESGTEFTRICLINTDRSIEFSADVKEDSIPDCDHPEDPSWKTRTVDTLAADISGSGKWPSSQIEFFYDWFASGEAKQIRFQQNAGSAPAGQGFFYGAYKLTRLNIAGTTKEYATGEITLQSDGAVLWSPASE